MVSIGVTTMDIHSPKERLLLETVKPQVDLIVETLHEIAKKALSLKIGARGLRTIMEESMLELMFNAPSEKEPKKIVISSNTINSEQTRKKEIAAVS